MRLQRPSTTSNVWSYRPSFRWTWAGQEEHGRKSCVAISQLACSPLRQWISFSKTRLTGSAGSRDLALCLDFGSKITSMSLVMSNQEAKRNAPNGLGAGEPHSQLVKPGHFWSSATYQWSSFPCLQWSCYGVLSTGTLSWPSHPEEQGTKHVHL